MNGNVVYLREPEFQPRKITNPMSWVKNLFKKAQVAKSEIEKKKVMVLLENTYNFYLDLYLTGIDKEKLVDIHPALYRAGYTVCTIAMQLAMEQMISVIKENRVDECYRKLRNHLAKRGKNGKGNRK